MKRKVAAFAACVWLLVLCACQGETAGPDVSVPSAPEQETPAVSTLPVTEQEAPGVSVSPEPADGEQHPQPVPEQTVQPTPVQTADPEPEETPVSADRLEAYFDGAVFIGDSIMEGIRQYVAKNRAEEPTLGNAVFLTSTAGVSVAGLVSGETDGPYYRYNGQNQPLTEILPMLECRRIFLQLGLNDLAAANPVVADSVDAYSRLIDLLQAAVPQAEIVVITNSPKVASTWLPGYTANRNFGNKLIGEFVDELIRMCDARGIPYVDAHAALLDTNGALPDGYCRDGFVHLNDAGAKVVVEELYRFAGERVR